MKHSGLRKVNAKLSYNRNIYYERIDLEKKEEQIKENTLFSRLLSSALICFIAFGILWFCKDLPYVNKISSLIKTAIQYNIDSFGVKDEEIGKIELGDGIWSISRLTDNTPLSFGKPLESDKITTYQNKVLLYSGSNPLVAASESGRVKSVEKKGMTVTIEIEHRANILTRYKGLSGSGVKVGDFVEKGQPIGLIGDNFLVFEILEKGTYLDLKSLDWL